MDKQTNKVIKLKVFDILTKKQRITLLSIQSKIDLSLINIKTNIYEIGRLLFKAKRILPHGMFQNWIEETWGNQLPYPTAACYKSIYETFKEKPTTVKLLPLTMLIQLKQSTFPDEIFKLVNDNPEAFSKDNPDEFRNIYNNYKNGVIDLNEWERLAKRQIKIGIAIYEGEERLRQTLRSQRTAKDGFTELTKVVKRIRRFYLRMRAFFPSMVGLKQHRPPDALIEFMDGPVLNDINEAIEQLERLKRDIEGRNRYWRHRLVEKNGVITDELIVN